MLHRHLAIIAVILLVGPLSALSRAAGAIGAGDSPRTTTIAGITVPADCALARREHPRLLFTKADLPDIRRRIAQQPLKEIYDILKATVDKELAQGPQRLQQVGAGRMLVPLGLLYHITGEEKYALACRDLTISAPFGVYATEGTYGYDLIYDLLTPDERRQCEEKIFKEIGRPYPGPSVLIPCLAMWGGGNQDAVVEKKLTEMHKLCLQRKGHLNDWAADRGGDGNSHGYIGQHEYVGTMGAFQAWRAATGEDWFDGFTWARTMAPYYIYHYLPGLDDTVNVGINSWGGRSAPIETGAEDFISIAQSKWKCGLTGWWVRDLLLKEKVYYHVLDYYWGALLWYDPQVPDISRQQFPQDMLFKTRGYLCMRSDWGKDATFVHFHCGRFETDGRNHADNNSFIIYRKVHLACDTGTRGVNNPEQTKYSDGQHHEKYFAQTIAHNSITVGTISLEPDPHGPLSRIMCGGQVSRVSMDWVKRYGLPAIDDNRWSRQAGQITAYETTPEFCYAVGDARLSYSPDNVKAFTRQFVYVRPGAVVIFDRISGVNADDPKRWYLHTMEQPQCMDGALEPDTTVHPEGHFVAGGITLRAPHGDSALFSKTLLPEKAIIRVLGGKGHQFEINGQNYDMNDLWYKEVGTPQYLERNCVGLWRIEVEPQARQADNVFLHVLWATDSSVQQMFPVQTIQADGQAGARFTADGMDVELTFATTGPIAGHIKLSRDGKIIHDRPLASAIEDNYQKWKSDPRFVSWMTNPNMRSVIGEKDQDAYKSANP